MDGNPRGRDKRVQRSDYVVSTPPINLSFRTYRSPCDVPQEQTEDPPLVTHANTTPAAKLPSAAHPIKPAFMTALATGLWPSAAASPALAQKTICGGWQWKNDILFSGGAGRVRATRDRQQEGGTQSGTSVSLKISSQRPQEQQLNAHAGTAGTFGPSGTRLSVCVSRQCSIISVCAPPQSVLAGTVLEPPTRHKARVKFVVTCVRLSHNQLQTLANLIPALYRVMPQPTISLRWLDLAHNQLTSIDPALKELVNLTVLYLHGNLIANYVHVQILQLIEKLQILTLVGNPLERENYRRYRQRVLALVPQLRVLDYTAVTKDDREAAYMYECGHAKRERLQREQKIALSQ